jgi:hypothetical protein
MTNKCKVILITTLIIFFYPKNCIAQFGCMDPQAINYSSIATINDGSCVYPATNYTLQIVDTISNDFNEISGFVFWNNFLYAHNDGGNSSTIYQLDTFGNITKTINLPSISNVDWEDIAQSNTHFLIGDIGNNDGNRTDLKIYTFPKSVIDSNSIITVPDSLIEIINFSYPDQTDFSSNFNNNKFDCEAVLYKNGLIHIFTKNWVDAICVHYTIPSVAGTYIATRIDSLNGQGFLITGADVIDSQIVLCGYQVSGIAECALWYIYDFDTTVANFMELGNKRKIQIGSALGLGQIEGICFKNTNGGYVCNERFNPISQINIPPILYQFETTKWFPYSIANKINSLSDKYEILIKFIENKIIIQSNKSDNVVIAIYDMLSKKIYSQKISIHDGTNYFNLPALNSGNYILSISYSKGITSKQFTIP